MIFFSKTIAATFTIFVNDRRPDRRMSFIFALKILFSMATFIDSPA